MAVTWQSLIAHAYPLGQHPPLALAAQEYHPVAQLPPPPPLLPAVVVVVLGPAAAESLAPVFSAAVILGSSASLAPDPEGSPAGTMTVTPLLVCSVVKAVGGHEVLSQFRPTRQQPPR